MIFFAVAAPTPGRLSSSDCVALLTSILSGLALAASACDDDSARPQARIAARTIVTLVAVRILDLVARGYGFRLRAVALRPAAERFYRPPGSLAPVLKSLGLRSRSECPRPKVGHDAPTHSSAACYAATGWVHALHRVAASAMSSLHCGHSFVVSFASPGLGMK